MKKPSITTSHFLSTSTIFILLLAWQIYAIEVNNPYLMPRPNQVFDSLKLLLVEWDTYIVILTTLKRLIFSMAISIFFGMVLGLISGVHYELEALLKPIVISLRTLPVISIVIIVLILYGNTFSLYLISFLLLFPIIYQAELDGIKNIDNTLKEVLKLDCDKCTMQTMRMVYLPLSIPFLRTGVIQSAGLGIKVLVVSEFIAQSKISIGKEIYFSRLNLEYSNVFAWTFILIFIVLIIEHLVNRYLKIPYET